MKSLKSHSHNYPDPYDFVFGPQLTIEFYGYQGTVTFADMSACVTAANQDMVRKFLADQGNDPIGPGPYVWSSGNVALHLDPDEQLTWAQWSMVPAAISGFVYGNELKGTQFIVLWHDLGPIGSGQLAASQPVPATIHSFPDPYDKHIADLGLTMEFYGYRGTISAVGMRDCVAVASDDIVRHLLVDEAPMSQEASSYSYSAGGVHLFLSPTEHLTWHMWAFVPIWIQEFVTENDFKETQFILLWEGFGVVGVGQLTTELNDTRS